MSVELIQHTRIPAFCHVTFYGENMVALACGTVPSETWLHEHETEEWFLFHGPSHDVDVKVMRRIRQYAVVAYDVMPVYLEDDAPEDDGE